MKEGDNLKQDLVGKLDEMLKDVQFIEEHSPQIIEQYHEKLRTKVKELLGDKQLDDSRIAAEVTIYADKVCVDEEIVRLRSHIEAVKKELLTGGSIGKAGLYCTGDEPRGEYDLIKDKRLGCFGYRN